MSIVKHIDHLNLSVQNLEQTIDWYARIFDFQVVEAAEQGGQPWAILKAGEALLCLYQRPELPFIERKTRPVHGMNHLSYRITDRSAWLHILERESLPLNHGHELIYDHSVSWYVTDPTGYEIEVVLWKDDTVRFA